MDLTLVFPTSAFGSTIAVIAAEAKPRYLVFLPMRPKSFEGVFAALYRLVLLVPTLVPPVEGRPVKRLTLVADGDVSWSTIGSEDRDNQAAKDFRLRTGVVIKRSPPRTSQLSCVEPLVGMFYNQLAYKRASLSPRLWGVMGVATSHMVNLKVLTGAESPTGSECTRFAALCRRLPDAPVWFGYPGQNAYYRIFGGSKEGHAGENTSRRHNRLATTSGTLQVILPAL
jgi:hypothetical protein